MIEKARIRLFKEGERLEERMVILVRHGQSESNVSGCLLADPPLTEQGRAQAIQAGEQLACLGEAVLIHTGLVRTLETVKLIKERGSLEGETVCLPDFQERRIGNLEGLAFTDFLGKYSQLEPLARQYGGSCIWFLEDDRVGLEPIVSMYDRVVDGLVKLTELSSPQVLVCHSGTIKMLAAFQSGMARKREILAQFLIEFEVSSFGLPVSYKLPKKLEMLE